MSRQTVQSRLGPHNLARLAELAQERRGDYPALLFEREWHRSAALHDRAARLAGGLIELGVEPGDRLLVISRNCPDVLVAYHAAWRAGAVVLPSIFMLSEREIAHILADSGAVVALVEADLLAKVRAAAARAKSQVRLVALGAAGAEAIPLAELTDAAAAPIVPRADADLAALLYTGGTTGRAKGVMLSHANLWHAGKSRAEMAYVEGFDRTIVALPLAHAFGVMVTASELHWPSRRQAALMAWFDAESWLTLAEELQVTDATLVPAMVRALLEQPVERHDLSSLRSLVCGSAPLPPLLYERLKVRLPLVELREGYGLTESAALVSGTPPGAVRPGSVGVPMAGVEVEIRDQSGGVVAVGEAGELCARSPSTMLGYWNDSEATAAVMREGWLQTGDIARRDGDGYLYIVDRSKDLIIRGGFNVYPRDVEEAMLAHPELAEAAVVGRPDEKRGEEVVAFVVPRAGASSDGEALVGWAREQIGGYKYPREVHLTEGLPRTSLGKVDRVRLRELAAASAAENGSMKGPG